MNWNLRVFWRGTSVSFLLSLFFFLFSLFFSYLYSNRLERENKEVDGDDDISDEEEEEK